jgi:hypothetical protein
MSSKNWSDGQKVDLRDHLLILADKALELEQWRIAQELTEMANTLDANRARWTAAGVAITLGLSEPRTLVGRESGRTTRMLCQAVSDAANGAHVGVIDGPPGVAGPEQAEKMLERLRSCGSVAVSGGIHRPRDGTAEDIISAVYIDHFAGWRRVQQWR